MVAIAEWTKRKGTYALYNDQGLDYEDLKSYMDEKGDLVDYPKAQEITMEDFWKLSVDILIPAALENAVTAEVAKMIQAKLVCEAANGPLTPKADEILESRKITVTPDILTNAGGVTVSYFEWVQNLYGYYWGEEEVQEKEEIAMVNAFNDIWKIQEEYKTTVRKAAYMHSVKK